MKKDKIMDTFIGLVEKNIEQTTKQDFNDEKKRERLRQAKEAFDLFVNMIIFSTCGVFWSIVFNMGYTTTLISFLIYFLIKKKKYF